jgi:hypothetical protein
VQTPDEGVAPAVFTWIKNDFREKPEEFAGMCVSLSQNCWSGMNGRTQPLHLWVMGDREKALNGNLPV